MATPSPSLRAASLFDVDPELGELLDADHLAEARVRAIVAVADLPPGEWSPAGLSRLRSRPFALLVLDGVVVRELLLAGSTTTELLGPCDIVDLGDVGDSLLPAQSRWSVPDRAQIAILDDRVLAIVRTWPAVARLLLERSARRCGRLAVHRAIAQLPRVEQRLIAFFGYTAERWGRVAPSGIVIPLQLTHETLGRLIGARRPTVSLALKELAAGALLERRHDGAWLLSYEGLDAIANSGAESTSWQPADARAVNVSDRPRSDRRAMQPPVPTDADFAALVARVGLLHEQHVAAVRRSVLIREHSRALRETPRGGQSRASAWEAAALAAPVHAPARKP